VLGRGLHSEIVFHLTPEGRLRDTVIQVATQSVELNDALRWAVRRADSARAFPASPPGRIWDRGRIVLRLASWESPRDDGVGLVQLIVPTIVAETPVSIVEIPQPRYPVGALRAGAEDGVDLLYVVGTDGRVMRGSLQIVGGEFRQFAEAAAAAVERGRFTPARVGGCAVPMEVAQRVKFLIR
jgi:TonB family protein